jgi:hypothetical protein
MAWCLLQPAGLPHASRLGNNIGQKLVLDGGDAVLERQFTLLEALDMQLISRRSIFLRRNLGIEIAVLGPQPCQFFTELALFRSLHRPSERREQPPALNDALSLLLGHDASVHGRLGCRLQRNEAIPNFIDQDKSAVRQSPAFVPNFASLQR